MFAKSIAFKDAIYGTKQKFVRSNYGKQRKSVFGYPRVRVEPHFLRGGLSRHSGLQLVENIFGQTEAAARKRAAALFFISKGKSHLFINLVSCAL